MESETESGKEQGNVSKSVGGSVTSKQSIADHATTMQMLKDLSQRQIVVKGEAEADLVHRVSDLLTEALLNYRQRQDGRGDTSERFTVLHD